MVNPAKEQKSDSTLPAYLTDPSLEAPAPQTTKYSGVDWKRALSSMILIRELEDLVGKKSTEGLFRTPVHLSIGQEAIPVGIALNLRQTDFAFGNHRSHGHYLAMGGSPFAILCEILGRRAGCSGGMGGSMHITAPEIGFIGSVPIVAGTIPIAVGAALQAKRSSADNIAVAFFGDGAVEEGVFHEALNFASVHATPVVFVCENNTFSSHMHIVERQPSRRMARFAEANCIESRSVDGNDVTEVYGASRDLIQLVRDERRPVFLEVFSYRWRAHVGPTDDLEIGLNRSRELPLWQNRDPIQRLFDALESTGQVESGWLDQERQRTQSELRKLWEQAVAEPDPDPDQLLSFLYTGDQR